MSMTPTTTEVSDGLELIRQGTIALIEQDDDYDLTGVAVQVLRIMGTMTDQYPLEAFTDEEIELITDATVTCLDSLMANAEQGDF